MKTARDKVIMAVYVDVSDLPPEEVADYLKETALTIRDEKDDSIIHYVIPVRSGTGTKVECVYPQFVSVGPEDLESLKSHVDLIIEGLQKTIEENDATDTSS